MWSLFFFQGHPYHGCSQLLCWSGFGLTTFSCRVEDSCVFPEELPKATLHQYFVLLTAILVYSVAIPLLAATEPWPWCVTVFQMPIEHPTSGGQARDKEAVALTSLYFDHSCAKHRLQLWSEATPHENHLYCWPTHFCLRHIHATKFKLRYR